MAIQLLNLGQTLVFLPANVRLNCSGLLGTTLKQNMTLKEDLTRRSLLGQAPALHSNIKLGWNRLPGTKLYQNKLERLPRASLDTQGRPYKALPSCASSCLTLKYKPRVEWLARHKHFQNKLECLPLASLNTQVRPFRSSLLGKAPALLSSINKSGIACQGQALSK
jgi:hypothetical protein